MRISSYDDTQRRQNRLEKVRRVTATILSMSEKQLDLLVDEIHDYKGMLQVTWKVSEPTEQQKLAFGTAWEMSGEMRQSVRHSVLGDGEVA